MKTISTIGFWAALLSVLFAIGYSIPQILSTAKVIPFPHDMFWLFLPSLFLAPSFVVAMVCLHYSASTDLKIWTAIGIAFAVLYCTLVTIVYFTQLTVVLPAQLKGELDKSNILFFPGRTFLMAVDCLGYFYMSLSTLFAAFAFKQHFKPAYRWMLYNGLLIFILIPAFFYPFFYYVGAVWMITFPVAMIQLTIFFRRNSMNKEA